MAGLGGCAGPSYRDGGRPPAGYAGEPPAVYSVERGDTLYSIAWRYDLNFRQVAYWNRIDPPYTIYPGQKLLLRPSQASNAAVATGRGSDTSDRPSSSTGAVKTSSPATKPTSRSKPAATSKPQRREAPRRDSDVAWRWPVDGPVLREFKGPNAGKQGVTIGGDAGTRVRAAADGRVVYSGSGLRGYGRLVIVRHNQTYLTAYAYNRELLVREGENVRAGQTVARMGTTPEGRGGLHFELRRNGKPVNPLSYLPRR